ncbi:lipase family alpha/beta hydrolase [Kitasatospora aureofaciens]|uniref:Lecithin:cholesterol acyltransferase n=1 Tax=Kitasatospora aureofaciens TaxID=1894 RepID=A0A1E7N1T4_KITAU|nr:hypothetical protein [Kitasatospora aureofaciens]QEV03491.1 hypothetical protein CP971_33615 [Streptomyces viridifaciens]ARF81988.1 hypothetical protein B6264_26675 [Kitasatospora aureofaciens]OEV34647.1 hypothetical protein HS99_0009115 [Kitasatospora aureofaciens]UKZ03715.1 lysophospholipase [Streptomyces viridifaciens]GGV01805.1 hypothetical protein GCM10010502_65520 [Kitasatospora aureofaciens]
MEHDLVVFLPGILGSRLTRDGKDVWHQSWQAVLQLRHPSKAVEAFKLPPGIGDDEPEPNSPWAVQADELVKGPDAMPGLLASYGYPEVRSLLERAASHDPRGGLHPDQYAVFTYDWRLSNRLNARRLKTWVERELAQWRERAPRFHPKAHDDEPKVVFICHSMGGLIARYYLEYLHGRDLARSLVTIGTPHRGAAKAIRFLTGNGIGPSEDQGWPKRKAAQLASRVNPALADIARSFPSVAQLLPVYAAALVDGGTRWRPLTEVPVGNLPTELVNDAFAFHEEFAGAWERNRATEAAPPYKVHCLGGRAHPTVHGVVVRRDGTLEFPTQLDNSQLWIGDGTVPEESAFAKWALDDISDAVWGGERHTTLAGAESFAHQLDAIRRAKPRRDLLAGEEGFSLVVPDFAVAGEPFEITVSGIGTSGRTVRARLTNNRQPGEAPVTLAPDGIGGLVGEVTGAAGTWILEVEAERPHMVCRDVVTIVGE